MMVATENLLGLNLKNLTFKDLTTVFQGLDLLNKTLSGIITQPKCYAEGIYNAAGNMLDNFSERIAAEMSEIVAIAKQRQPETIDDRALRFFLLMSDETWPHADPNCMVAVAQLIVAKMPTVEQIEKVRELEGQQCD